MRTVFCDRKTFIDMVATNCQSWILNLFVEWDKVVFDGVPESVHQSDRSLMHSEQEIMWQVRLKATSEPMSHSSDLSKGFNWSEDNAMKQAPVPAQPFPGLLANQLAQVSTTSTYSTSHGTQAALRGPVASISFSDSDSESKAVTDDFKSSQA
ncbi:hypothetical protein C0992_006766 [Termitomyces sp. T32_za158]|nr:hypothetical protein C0992_006766 [Termitomyces sp. T32_za158]